MRLISLSSDISSFHPVFFKPKGISLIVGKRASTENSNSSHRTYNGVGKSLLIELIHFCLGSNSINALQEAIPDWNFYLVFESEGERFVTQRNTSDQRKILLNNQEHNITSFKKEMGKLIFNLEEHQPLNFRPLIKRYIRPVSNGYNSFDSYDNREQPYQKLLCNTYVLGLNIDIVQRKRQFRIEAEKRRTLIKQLNNNDLYKRLAGSVTDPSIHLQELNDEIEHIEKELQSFIVAENYSEIERQANEIRNNLVKVRNEVVIRENALKRIDRSLTERPDISAESVTQVFQEANERLADVLEKELASVQKFHQDLILKRGEHLSNEKQKIKTELHELVEKQENLSDRLNKQLSYLNSVRALDEFVLINKRLSDLRSEANQIKTILTEKKQLAKEKMEFEARSSEENLASEQYLSEVEKHVSKLSDQFRSITKTVYPEVPSGLTIETNTGDNQIRFNIAAHIQNDASKGINSVKIFAFDFTHVTEGVQKCKFLVHDNQLYSDIDPRQRADLFRIAHKITFEDDIQYIASVNEDQVETMREHLTHEEYDNIITNSEILHLTDESTASKLLGIQVDVQY